MTEPQTETRSFYVRQRGDANGHVVEAVSFEDAALAFAELWCPAIDADVSVVVKDREDGRQVCLTLDLGEGSATPCG